MDHIIAQLFVEALAVNAELESYKAANAIEVYNGRPPSYVETAFDRLRMRFENIAQSIRERGEYL